MQTADIQSIIEVEIPIVKQMGVIFDEFKTDSCIASVPLAPNHNHKGTVFGGSLYSVCTSACYGLMYSLQIAHQLEGFDLVIGEGKIRYLKPVDRDFKVKAEIIPAEWSEFKKKISTNGFGKIQLKAKVFMDNDSTPLCDYSAVFVLMKKTN
ncbi:hypothetical protein DOM21_14220 [Bacteriovorax stolpii]|uniref:YiiD C-terminal domain-containing protein n=1 Tax=Bacteriovorax stolpii TaxID=960 RepID=UPI001159DA86|nr:YiiD C-terminal domain-containing protein [Bacteriovorax stolpii]QDK42585.1 hypothetical protein DOM21_14220 [Bacteriovorax stolpii]